MLYIYQHFRCIDLSFQLEDVKSKQSWRLALNAALKLEIANLRNPMRIDMIARQQLGLTSRCRRKCGSTTRPAGAQVAARAIRPTQSCASRLRYSIRWRTSSLSRELQQFALKLTRRDENRTQRAMQQNKVHVRLLIRCWRGACCGWLRFSGAWVTCNYSVIANISPARSTSSSARLRSRRSAAQFTTAICIRWR